MTETIPGGAYLVGGRYVNANGEPLNEEKIAAHLRLRRLAAGLPEEEPEATSTGEPKPAKKKATE